MEKISRLLRIDLNDPFTLLPILIFIFIVVWFIALFSDQPPE